MDVNEKGIRSVSSDELSKLVMLEEKTIFRMGFVEPTGFAFMWNDQLIQHLRAGYNQEQWNSFCEAVRVVLKHLGKEFESKIQ